MLKKTSFYIITLLSGAGLVAAQNPKMFYNGL